MMKTLIVILSILPIVCVESVFPNITTTVFPCYQDFCNYEKYCDEVNKRCERCSNKFSKCFTPEQHPQCTMFCMMNKPCPPITGLDNGTANDTDRNYLQGETISFRCNDGYHNIGTDQTVCMEYGVWSHQRSGEKPPYCEVMTCSIPTLPKHGTIKFTADLKGRLLVGSEVQYGCEEGYVLGRGNVTRLCMSDGTWSGSTPTCAQKWCPPPYPIDNGTFNGTKREYSQGETLSFRCSDGYHNIGTDQIVCMEYGVWSHQRPGQKPPYCEVTTCPIPVLTKHGTLKYSTNLSEGLVVGSEVQYGCEQGYVLIRGNVTRLCLSDGTWSETTPTCVLMTCSIPTLPKHGTIKFTADLKGRLLVGSEVQYGCEEGYVLGRGNVTRLCMSDGTWSGSTPTCAQKWCPPPYPIDNGTFNGTKREYSQGETLSFRCSDGYHNIGTDQIVCMEYGVWSHQRPGQKPPYCEVTTCPIPVLTKHGTLKYSTNLSEGLVVGSEVQYGCEQGYVLIRGNVTRLCLSDGTWSETTPTCVQKRCPPPYPIDNGTFNGTKREYSQGETLSFRCSDGYHNIGTDQIVCMEYGVWSHQRPGQKPPYCEVTTCPIPVLTKHGTLKYSTNLSEGLVVGSEVQYGCEQGYVLIRGNVTRLCLSDGTWSETTPTCVQKRCPPPYPIDNGTFNGTKREYSQGETLSFRCSDGYHNIGTDQIVCMEYGVWSHQRPGQKPPYCEVTTCPIPVLPKHGTLKYSTNLSEGLVVGSEVQHGCEQGYVLTRGNVTRLCLSDGTWSETTTTCAPNPCAPPVHVDFGTFNDTKRQYSQGETLSFQCNEGYHNAGQDQIVCTEYGVWSHQRPGNKPPYCEEYKDTTWKILTIGLGIVTGGILVISIILKYTRIRRKHFYCLVPDKNAEDDNDTADNGMPHDSLEMIDLNNDVSLKAGRNQKVVNPRPGPDIENGQIQKSADGGETANEIPKAESRGNVSISYTNCKIIGNHNSINKDDHSVSMPKVKNNNNITNNNTGNKEDAEDSPEFPPRIPTTEAVLETSRQDDLTGDSEIDIDQKQSLFQHEKKRSSKSFQSNDGNLYAQECSRV